YKRFRSLKDQDTAAPLSQRKKDEVEKFISELAECVAKADQSVTAQPDTIVKPPVTTAVTATAMTTTATPKTKRQSGTKENTAALESRGDEGEGDASTKERPSAGAKRLVARLTGGIALIGAGDLDIPAQPVFGLFGGY